MWIIVVILIMAAAAAAAAKHRASSEDWYVRVIFFFPWPPSLAPLRAKLMQCFRRPLTLVTDALDQTPMLVAAAFGLALLKEIYNRLPRPNTLVFRQMTSYTVHSVIASPLLLKSSHLTPPRNLSHWPSQA